MFEKDLIAVDISNERITILIGNRYKIENGIILETPKQSFQDDRIQDVRAIAETMAPYVKKVKTKDIAFVLRGQDIITRHMVLPMAKDEAMRDTIDFELRQFIGDRVDEYYCDYEVTHFDKNDQSGNCEVLIVAVEKNKIEAYLELGRELGLNVKAIDIYANAISRVFRALRQSVTKGVKTTGVINIDADSTSISILEWGKLSIEKYQSYGVASTSEMPIQNVIEYNDFLDKIELIEAKEYLSKSERFFQETVAQYNSLIQYFTSGKVKKNLDRIYVIGTALRIKGVEQYFEVNLNAKVGKSISFGELKSTVKYPSKVELKDYILPYGLLLRRE